MQEVHLHLVSDATGETNHQVVRACLAQFDRVRPREHVWSLVRTEAHIEKIAAAVENNPGPVFFTLVDRTLRQRLVEVCRRLKVPCVSVLDPVADTLSSVLGAESRGRPGRQHAMDQAYFDRIEAMEFTLAHDDGQHVEDLAMADIVIVGVSRTSKTPTSLYLANRGYRTANVPVVPNLPVPRQLLALDGTFVVALTNEPGRLSQIRRNRMLMLNQRGDNDYADLDQIRREVAESKRLYAASGWPVIDVARRSIEETAAAVLQRYERFHGRES